MGNYKNGRKLNRLQGYNYSLSCFYFVTICVQDFIKCLGVVNEDFVKLNSLLHKPTDIYPHKKYGLLSKIIKSFKCMVIMEIRNVYDDKNFRFQRSFHDHIIRNEKELNRIREYIKNNPKKWYMDRNNMS